MKLNLDQFLSAVKYNKERTLLPGDLTVLTACWQEEHNLTVDGKFGPLTAKDVRAASTSAMIGPEVLSLPEMVVKVAVEQIGKGEEGGNNLGPFMRQISIDGKEGYMWCSLFSTYCYEEACRRLDLPMPFERSSSSKKAVKNMGAVGSLFTNPKLAMPGDFITWHRGLGITFKGHIGIVEFVDADGLVHTVEGNTGTYPSKVKRLVHDVSKERLYKFSTLRKGIK